MHDKLSVVTTLFVDIVNKCNDILKIIPLFEDIEYYSVYTEIFESLCMKLIRLNVLLNEAIKFNIKIGDQLPTLIDSFNSIEEITSDNKLLWDVVDIEVPYIQRKCEDILLEGLFKEAFKYEAV
ncbi:MAG: hypothetical protein LBS29_04330 [Endomicrobium sp.]|nr:hypothetical protein [Endomicrobium sp.]